MVDGVWRLVSGALIAAGVMAIAFWGRGECGLSAVALGTACIITARLVH